jgi:hypothetical protein
VLAFFVYGFALSIFVFNVLKGKIVCAVMQCINALIAVKLLLFIRRVKEVFK